MTTGKPLRCAELKCAAVSGGEWALSCHQGDSQRFIAALYAQGLIDLINGRLSKKGASPVVELHSAGAALDPSDQVGDLLVDGDAIAATSEDETRVVSTSPQERKSRSRSQTYADNCHVTCAHKPAMALYGLTYLVGHDMLL